jgi:hypothetical protein
MNVAFVGFSRIFLLGILIFKGLTARRFYKSFGVKGLSTEISQTTIGLVKLVQIWMGLPLYKICRQGYFFFMNYGSERLVLNRLL